ncbi:MAG: flagellar biosynthetic protein FliO [Endozoicomonadaceae bacterium]|nr:flagellar biosynthetic protein FliO [Endozoicomonadaceae bacterium]
MKKNYLWISLIFYQSISAVYAESSDQPVNIPEGITLRNITETLVALVLVSIVIFVFAWLIKKINPQLRSSYNKNMKVLARLPISAREQLVLIEIYDQQILLGVTSGSISLIKELPKTTTENKENQQDDQKHFQQLLKR